LIYLLLILNENIFVIKKKKQKQNKMTLKETEKIQLKKQIKPKFEI